MEYFKTNLSSKVIENIISLSQNPDEYKIKLQSLDQTSLEAYFYYLSSYLTRRNEITPATIILEFDELVRLINTLAENNTINCILYDIFQITCVLLQNIALFTDYIATIRELSNSDLKMVSFLTELFRIDISPISDLLMKNLFAGDHIDRNLIIDCLKANYGTIDKRALFENINKSRDNIFVLSSFIDEMIEERTQLNTQEFWTYLAECICQEDNKYAVSILKIIIKYFHSTQQDFRYEIYFTWTASQNATFYKDWNNFLLILDSLLEKQNHLIMPTLGLIKTFKCIDQFWLYALLEKIVSHTNSAVTNFGICYIFENYDIDVLQHQSKLLANLLAAVNNNYMYAYDYNAQLIEFFRKSPAAIFSNITNSNLNGITLYNFLIVFQSHLIDNNFRDCDLLVNLIKTVANCQNLTIRSACQIALIKILNRTWSQYNFSELLNLIDTTVQIIDNKSNILLYFDRDATALHDYGKIIGCGTISTDTKIKIIFYLLHVNVINVNNLTDIVRDKQNGDEFVLTLILNLKQKNINLDIKLDEFYKNPLNLEILCSIRFNLTDVVKQLDLDDLATLKLISDHINYADHPDVYRKHLHFLNSLNFKACDIKLFTCLQNNLLRSGDDRYDQIISNSQELLEIADKTNLIYIFDTIELVASQIDQLNNESLFLCIDRGYREIVALRKSEYYWILIKKFIKIILFDDRAIQDCDWRLNVVEKYVDILMEEARHINGIGYIIYKRLLILDSTRLIGWEKFAGYLIKGLVFGETLMKREQVLEAKIMKLIVSENLNLDIKSHFTYETNSKIRALCITFLFKINKLNCHDFLADITAKLVAESLRLGKTKPRYYAYSMHHRVKLRTIQSLAILFTLNKSNFVHSEFILTTLETENNQTNITILLELLAAELLSADVLLSYVNTLNKISPSKIISFLIISYLKCIKDGNLSFCETIIKLFLHWTMAQHFQTRLYAQITILKLIEYFNLSGHEKYALIYTNLKECLKYGNYDINSKKLLNDFRFNPDVNLNFHNLLSLETILYNISRITEMPEEEIVPINLLKIAGCSFDYDFNDPANYEWDSSLDSIDVITNNHNTANLIVENEIEVEQMVDGNFQKKIVVPLQQMIPRTIEQFGYEAAAVAADTTCSEGLIIVASLVTRQPNLGGLARSCEIFGVRKYVIDSLRHTDNREFQALSVTAEKWLQVEEVKAHHLKPYLQMMKRKGYTVIGAEQTSNSISIEKINFPKKSIIVLGNEKEGVPANLISMFDITAEIPQFGVVRSLNVHVTGAIFMWEYAKQHLVNL